MKALEQHFSVTMFIMLYNVVLTFESLYEILELTCRLTPLFVACTQQPGGSSAKTLPSREDNTVSYKG